MDVDPTQDTLPTRALRRAAESPIGRFIRSVPGAFLILAIVLGGVLTLAAMGGYYAGVNERNRTAATAQAVELDRQFQLGIQDMQAGRYLLAIQRFEFILSVDPAFPEAAGRLAEARLGASLGTATPPGPLAATPTLIITVGPETAQTLFAEARAAFDTQDWDTALQKISALRIVDPDYERAAVHRMTFDSLRSRGIAHIEGGKLELGLADLDQASKIGGLDVEAQQYQQWATIYIAGVSYWGLNWPRTIETFELLYTLAPYFRDTITRLRDAHLAYAAELEASGDPCNAVIHYAAALDSQFDQAVEDRRAAADLTCQFGTPTPDGTLTPFPTPDGTLTPFPASEATETPIPPQTP
jgi:tetratricopeptide (TPR) repeat protein